MFETEAAYKAVPKDNKVFQTDNFSVLQVDVNDFIENAVDGNYYNANLTAGYSPLIFMN